MSNLHHPETGQAFDDPDLLLTGEKNHGARRKPYHTDPNFIAFSNMKLHELLRDWRAAYGSVSLERFMQHTKMDMLLTPEQWTQMAEFDPPKLVPTLTLGQHMIAALLRDGVMNSTHFYLSSYNGSAGSFNKLERALPYAEQHDIPLLRVENDVLENYRLAVAGDVLNHHLRQRVADGEDGQNTVSAELMEHPFSKALVAKLQKRSPELDGELLLANIQRGLHERPAIVENSIVEMMQDFSLDKIQTWIQSVCEAPELENAGDVLRFLRQCRGLNQMQVGGNDPVRLNGFASSHEGRGHVTVNLVDKVKSGYSLTGQELEIVLRLSNPALNQEWLDKQPKDKRWRPALRAVRRALGLTPEKLDAYKPDFVYDNGNPCGAEALIESTERKHHPLMVKNWKALRTVFRQREKELGVSVLSPVIEQLIEESLPAKKVDAQAGFSQEWLDKQPHAKQAGLLLKAIRNKAGMSSDDLSEGLFSPQRLRSMEVGSSHFSAERLDEMLTRIRTRVEAGVKSGKIADMWLTPELEQRLRTAAEKRYWPDINENAPQLNIAPPAVERSPEGFMNALRVSNEPLNAMCEYFGISRAECDAQTGMCKQSLGTNSQKFTSGAAQRYLDVLCALNQSLPTEQQLDMHACSAALFSAMPVSHGKPMQEAKTSMGTVLSPGDKRHMNTNRALNKKNRGPSHEVAA